MPSGSADSCSGAPMYQSLARSGSSKTPGTTFRCSPSPDIDSLVRPSSSIKHIQILIHTFHLYLLSVKFGVYKQKFAIYKSEGKRSKDRKREKTDHKRESRRGRAARPPVAVSLQRVPAAHFSVCFQLQSIGPLLFDSHKS